MPVESLGRDLLERIFFELRPLRELVVLSAVCKVWNRTLRADSFWRECVQREFPGMIDRLSNASSFSEWRQLYSELLHAPSRTDDSMLNIDVERCTSQDQLTERPENTLSISPCMGSTSSPAHMRCACNPFRRLSRSCYWSSGTQYCTQYCTQCRSAVPFRGTTLSYRSTVPQQCATAAALYCSTALHALYCGYAHPALYRSTLPMKK